MKKKKKKKKKVSLRVALIGPIRIIHYWLGFQDDITKIRLMDILKKDLFPAHLIKKVINCHWDPKQSLSPGFSSHHLTYVLL